VPQTLINDKLPVIKIMRNFSTACYKENTVVILILIITNVK